MVKARVFKYVEAFEGLPRENNFKLFEEDLPPIKDGEFLAEALFLSVDPYMRIFNWAVGRTFLGEQIARIIESKNPKYPVGRLVVGAFGWRTHTVSDGSPEEDSLLTQNPYLLPDIGNLSPSLGIGILGMPGNTAYLGFYKLLQPKAGETLVVSGAAGAVGSVVGQIGKLAGCTVIGITGSDEKGQWLIKELGFDHFINYKKSSVASELPKIVPQGIDMYYDNVGGDISTSVLTHMNQHGRITVCGIISEYNQEVSYGYPARLILFKELRVEGFYIWAYRDRWLEGINQTLQWIKEGKIKYKETVTEGFQNMPKAFIAMLTGGNTGKAVVKV